MVLMIFFSRLVFLFQVARINSNVVTVCEQNMFHIFKKCIFMSQGVYNRLKTLVLILLLYKFSELYYFISHPTRETTAIFLKHKQHFKDDFLPLSYQSPLGFLIIQKI